MFYCQFHRNSSKKCSQLSRVQSSTLAILNGMLLCGNEAFCNECGLYLALFISPRYHALVLILFHRIEIKQRENSFLSNGKIVVPTHDHNAHCETNNGEEVRIIEGV